MPHVAEILPHVRQELTYSTWSISWVLMFWRRKEPGHQHSWYWLRWAETIRSHTLRVKALNCIWILYMWRIVLYKHVFFLSLLNWNCTKWPNNFAHRSGFAFVGDCIIFPIFFMIFSCWVYVILHYLFCFRFTAYYNEDTVKRVRSDTESPCFCEEPPAMFCETDSSNYNKGLILVQSSSRILSVTCFQNETHVCWIIFWKMHKFVCNYSLNPCNAETRIFPEK